MSEEQVKPNKVNVGDEVIRTKCDYENTTIEVGKKCVVDSFLDDWPLTNGYRNFYSGGMHYPQDDFKLVEDQPWTPKSGEVVECSQNGKNWSDPVRFVGMSFSAFVCLKQGEGYERWVHCRQTNPRLTAAQAENAKLHEELGDLKNKLKEILDRIERVS